MDTEIEIVSFFNPRLRVGVLPWLDMVNVLSLRANMEKWNMILYCSHVVWHYQRQPRAWEQVMEDSWDAFP